jgi:hypothetical protein
VNPIIFKLVRHGRARAGNAPLLTPGLLVPPDAAVAAVAYAYVGTGGLQSGGTADVLKVKLPQIAGGMQTAGAAAALKVKAVSGSGGFATAGAAPVLKVKDLVGTGGAQAGGAAALAKVKLPPSAGGINAQGAAATLLKVKIPSSVGGYQTAGAAPTSFLAGAASYAYTGSGGITLAGTAPVLKVKLAAVSGGLVTGGAAAVVKSKEPQAFGGLVAAGSADLAKVKAVQGIGGMQAAGAATEAKVKVPQAGGPSSLSGAAATSFVAVGPRTRTYEGSGGFFLDGAAATAGPSAATQAGGGGGGRGGGGAIGWFLHRQATHRVVGASGTIALGGSAKTHFQPQAPATVVRTQAVGGIVLRGAAQVEFLPAPGCAGAGAASTPRRSQEDDEGGNEEGSSCDRTHCHDRLPAARGWAVQANTQFEQAATRECGWRARAAPGSVAPRQRPSSLRRRWSMRTLPARSQRSCGWPAGAVARGWLVPRRWSSTAPTSPTTNCWRCWSSSGATSDANCQRGAA